MCICFFLTSTNEIKGCQHLTKLELVVPSVLFLGNWCNGGINAYAPFLYHVFLRLEVGLLQTDMFCFPNTAAVLSATHKKKPLKVLTTELDSGCVAYRISFGLSF
jgi:hypothetical protein